MVVIVEEQPNLSETKLAIAHDLAEQIAKTAQRLDVLCGARDIALSQAKEAGATDEQLAEATDVDGQETTEHAQRYSGGGMHVRNPHPEIERVFPLAEWIQAEQQLGGKIYCRRIVVIEDWTELEEQPT